MQVLFVNFLKAGIADCFGNNGKCLENKHHSSQSLLTINNCIFLQRKPSALGSHKYDCSKEMLVPAVDNLIDIIKQAVTVGF